MSSEPRVSRASRGVVTIANEAVPAATIALAGRASKGVVYLEAIFDYAPQGPLELQLRVGDKVKYVFEPICIISVYASLNWG
jgi:hypothetical protein